MRGGHDAVAVYAAQHPGCGTASLGKVTLDPEHAWRLLYAGLRTSRSDYAEWRIAKPGFQDASWRQCSALLATADGGRTRVNQALARGLQPRAFASICGKASVLLAVRRIERPAVSQPESSDGKPDIAIKSMTLLYYTGAVITVLTFSVPELIFRADPPGYASPYRTPLLK